MPLLDLGGQGRGADRPPARHAGLADELKIVRRREQQQPSWQRASLRTANGADDQSRGHGRALMLSLRDHPLQCLCRAAAARGRSVRGNRLRGKLVEFQTGSRRRRSRRVHVGRRLGRRQTGINGRLQCSSARAGWTATFNTCTNQFDNHVYRRYTAEFWHRRHLPDVHRAARRSWRMALPAFRSRQESRRGRPAAEPPAPEQGLHRGQGPRK